MEASLKKIIEIYQDKEIPVEHHCGGGCETSFIIEGTHLPSGVCEVFTPHTTPLQLMLRWHFKLHGRTVREADWNYFNKFESDDGSNWDFNPALKVDNGIEIYR